MRESRIAELSDLRKQFGDYDGQPAPGPRLREVKGIGPVALERLEAILHQLELHQREISGDSYPYGLQLILQALSGATHYSDPIAMLDLEPVIDDLRQKIEDNPNRPRLILTVWGIGYRFTEEFSKI